MAAVRGAWAEVWGVLAEREPEGALRAVAAEGTALASCGGEDCR